MSSLLVLGPGVFFVCAVPPGMISGRAMVFSFDGSCHGFSMIFFLDGSHSSSSACGYGACMGDSFFFIPSPPVFPSRLGKFMLVFSPKSEKAKRERGAPVEDLE
jgi:hypothetical protein